MAITINLSHIPTDTGVYRFFDANGRVLYVGKAINLRERIRDHRRSKNIKIQQLLQEATELDWEVTSSEATALLREAELIKRHQPRYNTLLRDDSQYFYVKFTNDQLPKVLVTHQPLLRSRTGATEGQARQSVVGPFTEGRTLRLILKTLRRSLPFCTCLQSHRRECLNAHLGLCLDYCCRQDVIITPPQRRAYHQTITKLQRILRGDLAALKQKLLIELAHQLKRDNLERATQLKREIEAINALGRESGSSKSETSNTTERLKILRELQQLLKLTALPHRIEAYDCSHFGGTDRVGTMVGFLDGEHAPAETRYFKIRGRQKDDLGMLEETLTRRLKHPDWTMPNLILIDGGITHFRCARAVLTNWERTCPEPSRRIPLVSFAKPLRQLYFHSTKPPLALATLPNALRLFLEEVAARVHRAAIGFHRRVRGRHF